MAKNVFCGKINAPPIPGNTFSGDLFGDLWRFLVICLVIFGVDIPAISPLYAAWGSLGKWSYRKNAPSDVQTSYY